MSTRYPALLALLTASLLWPAGGLAYAQTNPACADGLDNDADELVDFPADPGCHAATDDTEYALAASETGDFRMVVAVASSGTLNGDNCSGLFTGGDGSSECPGSAVACNVCSASTCDNGLPDDSRLFHVKTALWDVFLRPEGEFALVRASQQPAGFACPTDSPFSVSGGWLGGPNGCTGASASGDVLVAFSGENFPALTGYVDGSANTDGEGVPAEGFDFELRATGARPLAGILTSAKTYLDAARADDEVADCRPYRLVLLADGGESCTGDAVAAATALFDSGVPVFVLGHAVSDPAAVAELDSIAAAGGTGTAVFVSDRAELASALQSHADDSTLVESCNGSDDDCDDLVDEDFPRLGDACDNGLRGVCRREGVQQCTASQSGTECVLAGTDVAPSEEICDGLDNDCNGLIDDHRTCRERLCNGRDDDRDGQVDEGFMVGQPCDNGKVGVCRATGVMQCRNPLSSYCKITQPGQGPTASDLACNGKDDDCDGLLDEEAVGEMVTIGSFRIDRYEASRPDATDTDAGGMDHRPCSKPNAIPWFGVTWAEAAARCASAGKRLCTAGEWETACGGAGGSTYPYGNVYNPTACNGRDLNPTPHPTMDVLLPTGSLAGCVSAVGALDLSGNIAEWTATPVGATHHVFRGGAYDSYGPGLTCQIASARDAEWWQPTLGFRCCSDLPSPAAGRPSARRRKHGR